jgi:hypothetical protein
MAWYNIIKNLRIRQRTKDIEKAVAEADAGNYKSYNSVEELFDDMNIDFCSCPGHKTKYNRWSSKFIRALGKLNPLCRYDYTYYDNIKYFFNKGNKVVFKTLDYRWHEPCDKMLHASFELLREYVEDEHWEHTIDPNQWDEQIEEAKVNPRFEEEYDQYVERKNRDIEIMELYNWWKQYSIAPSPWDKVTSCRVHNKEAAEIEGDVAYAQDESNLVLEQVMFERLAKLRPHLWE